MRLAIADVIAATLGRMRFGARPNDHDKPMRPAPAFEASMAGSLFLLGSPLQLSDQIR